MGCTRCHSNVLAGSAEMRLNVLGPSSNCLSPRSLDIWKQVENHLVDQNQPDGWHKVKNENHVFAHRVLSQVIYQTLEPPNPEKNEVAFDIPDPEDIIYLLWSSSCAVGFCTLKPKGSAMGEYQEYALTTLDTIFIRTSHRRRGHVSALLHLLSDQFGDIGFSQPVSDSMLQVLAKILTGNKQYRRTFWEVTGSGEEGNRKLIWFQLRRTIQAPCKTPLDQCTGTCRVAALKSSAHT